MRFNYHKGVRYVAPWKQAPAGFTRCNTCGRAWDDEKPTSLTPAPSARCPFEYMHREPDFYVSGGGTIYMLTPNTKRAKRWANENLPEDRQTLGDGIAVEHRYIGDIVEGIKNDGLTVR